MNAPSLVEHIIAKMRNIGKSVEELSFFTVSVPPSLDEKAATSLTSHMDKEIKEHSPYFHFPSIATGALELPLSESRGNDIDCNIIICQ